MGVWRLVEDGVTKMSWTSDINIRELEKRSKVPGQIILVKKTLLIGKCYTPYFLQVSLTPLTVSLRHKLHVSVKSIEHQLEEDKQESNGNSCTKKNIHGLFSEHKPLCAIWMEVNEKRVPLVELSGECKLWRATKTISEQLGPDQTYALYLHLWFKINEPLAQTEIDFIQQLCDLYVKQTDCDIHFDLTNGQSSQSIGAHKCILKARSPVFTAMFQHEMQEAKTGKVFIKDIEPEIFKDLVYFIYSGNLGTSLTEEKAKLLFLAADKYDFKDLKNICLRFLLNYIERDNVLHLYEWADNYSVDNLKDAALKFVADNYDQVCSTDEWKDFAREYPTLNVLVTRER